MDRDTHTVKRLDVVPQSLQQGAGLTLRGAGWGACPVHVKVDGAPRLGIHVAQGFRAEAEFREEDFPELRLRQPWSGISTRPCRALQRCWSGGGSETGL